jgi:hypothetical protein
MSLVQQLAAALLRAKRAERALQIAQLECLQLRRALNSELLPEIQWSLP